MCITLWNLNKNRRKLKVSPFVHRTRMINWPGIYEYKMKPCLDVLYMSNESIKDDDIPSDLFTAIQDRVNMTLSVLIEKES